jgi:hypothetical protein
MLLRDVTDEARCLLGLSWVLFPASSSFLPLQLNFDRSEAIGVVAPATK